MDLRQNRLSIEEARKIDMVEYLSKLGHEPAKIRGNDYWYLSPLRSEKTASFKINRKINKWYDHGMGKGGSLIDFGILYHNCTVGEFLNKAAGNFSFHPQHALNNNYEVEVKPEPKIQVVKVNSLTSLELYGYLHQRKVPVEVADHFCKEVVYELNGKEYFAIGFKNDSGGYELRNPYFKASSSPKDISTFDNASSEVAVFEGFMDFLSFITICKADKAANLNFLVLNSVSFFEKARLFMEQHNTIRLYLDRDSTGQNYLKYAKSLSPKYKDESKLYKNYKDLNDWVMNFGKIPKKGIRHKPR